MNERAMKCLGKSRWKITCPAQLTRLLPQEYRDYSVLCKCLSKEILGKDIALEGAFDPDSFRVVIKNRNTKDKQEYGVHFTNDINEFAVITRSDGKQVTYSYKDFQNRSFYSGETVNTVMYYQAVFKADNGDALVTWFDLKLAKEAEENRWLKKIWLLANLSYRNRYYATPSGICIYPDDLKVQTEYPSVRGLSDETLREWINHAIEGCGEDFLPEQIKTRYHLMDEKKAVRELHHPVSMQELKKAQNRILFDDILYFCCGLQEDDSSDLTFDFADKDFSGILNEELFRDLSEEQREAILTFTIKMSQGRLNGILEGPDETGMIPVIVFMAMMCCKNSYQAAICTSTVEVARNLYEKTISCFEKNGIAAALFSSDLDSSERKIMKKNVEDGSTQILFGRREILHMNFPKLSLVIFDNEQVPGIIKYPQIRSLEEKGINVLRLSTCSLPDNVKKMFTTEKNIEWITLQENGSEKTPQIIFSDSWKESLQWVQNTIKNKKQAYIICPATNLIEDNKTETVDDVYEHYCPYVENIAIVSNHLKRKSVTDIWKAFSSHKLDVVISTSDHIDELPISVDLVVVHQAEKLSFFELNDLKALTNILNLQADPKNEKLKKYCEMKCPYDVLSYFAAKKSPSELIGRKVSYFNDGKYIMQILQNPDLYYAVKKISCQMKTLNQLQDFEDGYEIENGIVCSQ